MTEIITQYIGFFVVGAIFISTVFLSFGYMMEQISKFWDKVRNDTQQVAYDRISFQLKNEAYWFAGFQDKIDPQILLEVISDELRCSCGFRMSQIRDNAIQKTRKQNGGE